MALGQRSDELLVVGVWHQWKMEYDMYGVRLSMRTCQHGDQMQAGTGEPDQIGESDQHQAKAKSRQLRCQVRLLYVRGC